MQRYVNDIFCMKIFDTKYANFESICDNLSIALEVQPHSDDQCPWKRWTIDISRVT